MNRIKGIQTHLDISMNTKIYRLAKNRQGQSLLEFALIIPIIIIVLVGIFDLGRAFFALITINNAAREGARYGTMHRGDFTGMVNAAVAEALNSGIEILTTDVVVTCPLDAANKCTKGDEVRVTVNYTFESLLSMFIPATINMSRYVEMAVQ